MSATHLDRRSFTLDVGNFGNNGRRTAQADLLITQMHIINVKDSDLRIARFDRTAK